MELVSGHAAIVDDGDDDDPNLAAAHTTWEPHRERQFLFDSRRGSLAGSFTLGASLKSFASRNSMTSSIGPLDAAGGRLVFATNSEMEKLMYGDYYHGGGCDDDDLRMSTIDETEHTALSSEPTSDDAPSCVKNSILRSSLSTSATLGIGSFSTVRLAWRREIVDAHNNNNNNNNIDTNGVPHSTSSSHRQADDDAESEHRGELVAVKIVQKSILKQIKTMEKGPDNHLIVHTAFDNIEREIDLMQRFNHPNLVRLYEVIDSVESDTLLMVLEYVSLGEILSNVNGTNRYKRMRYRNKVQGLTSEGHFDERHSALYFVDIMHGLAYLHRNRICHRDIKPENILLCASGICKIGDFGVSYCFEDELSAIDDNNINDDTSNNEVRNIPMQNDEENGSTTLKLESDKALEMINCYNSGMLRKTEGTWCFWSPEMCDASSSAGFSGYAADLWAVGICLYIFATGTLPFFSFDPSVLFDMIAIAMVPYEGQGLSDNLIDLLGKLLEKDPSKRAGVGDCLKHTFCAQARIERINTVDCKLMSDENIDTEIKELDAMHGNNSTHCSARLNLANLKRERSLRSSVGMAQYSTMKKWCRENFMGKSSS